MKINCPNCSTQFSVPDAALGESGKKLKCAKCGHKWFQAPPDAEPDEPEVTEPEPGPDVEAEAGLDEQGHAAFAVDEEEGQDDAEAADPFDRDEEDAAPGGGDHRDEPADGPSAGYGAVVPPPPAGRGSLLDDGGDFLDFEDEDEEERALVAAAAEAAAAEAAAAEASTEEHDRPEPIAFKLPRAADGGKQPSRAAGVLWGLVALLAVSGLVGAAYLFRIQVVAAWPAAAVVYEAVGIEARPVGAGLAIRNVQPERRRTADGEILVLQGVIANTTEEALRVPLLNVSIFRGGQLSRREVVPPPREELKAGETVSFRVVVEETDPLADNVTVSFEARETAKTS